jgi:dolichyl-phosphate beta-glucosyltransferase
VTEPILSATAAEGADRLTDSPYLSVILPAYNEAASIGRTLTAVRTFLDSQEYSYEVIVAADGDDATPEIVRELARDWPGLRLSAERGRHGKGQGLRRGVALARGEIIGFIDADYKTPIDDLTKVLPWLGDGYDVVIGSRRQDDSRVEISQRWYRRWGSQAFALARRVLIGLHGIRDTQCGFKFFTQRAAREIFRRSRIDGYMYDVEILWLAQQLGYRIKEVGVQWRDDRDSRSEHLQVEIQNVVDLLRIRFHRY